MNWPNNHRRRQVVALTTAVAALLAAGLTGCATPTTLVADAASFGTWPAGRAPGSYAIERLPSQQVDAERQRLLEDALRPALARAGFAPAADGAQPDVLVQAGARVSRSDLSPWDDPLWWPGGFGIWRHGPWRGPAWRGGWGWSARFDASGPRYERSVAVLLRDRASGQPLYEARASSEGYSDNAAPLLAPLFAAALADFPADKAEPHAVSVPLAPTSP